MFNVLTYDKIPADGLSWLPRDKYSIAPECSHPDAILLRSFDLHSVPIPESVLAVARSGSGVNNIPVEACSKRGIPVFNAPGANANAVKELTLAGMLLAARNVAAAWDFARSLKGDDTAIQHQVEKEKKRFDGFELAGKALGVLGLGAIGVQVANSAIGLGMHVYGFDPSLTVNRAWQLSSSVIGVPSIDDLLAKADLISLHIPLNDQTNHVIDKKHLALMKQGAILINFARAGVVDEAALGAALDSGKLRTYVTDFATRAFLDHPHAIVLPHLGASTAEAEVNCATVAAESLVDFLENGEIRNSVNFPKVVMPRSGRARLAIANENVPGMVSQISAALAAANLNIDNLLNKSLNKYAYTLIDLNTEAPPETLQLIRAINGVLSARIVPKSAGGFE
ncbi:3-phosphoglycerate dehydrogenase family protein [Methylocapsa aurea]|uniref:3-phosphoglycerate dehydrogenase family protein n=1 Tax=Methylocapsa aurea TaxID=663610 RepID=UPI00055EB906|nr:3-phosphoglycerate dehydrogenase family protein [Methylocapsa aurea]